MHPYFDAYKDDESIIEAPEQFDWAWDNFEPTKDILQNMVFEESLQFHTEDEEWKSSFWHPRATSVLSPLSP